jgi:hypothetical protein
MDRLVPRGKFLFEGERKFHASGVSYGPFAPNSRGERYPEPERAAQDFALIHELGANVVRTYVPSTICWRGARRFSCITTAMLYCHIRWRWAFSASLELNRRRSPPYEARASPRLRSRATH